MRDFKYEDSALEKQKKELAELEVEEKELWVSRVPRQYPQIPTLADSVISLNCSS